MSWNTPDICKSFLSDLIAKTQSVSGNKGLGVFYWEPECINSWNGYSLGAFDNNGKPESSLDAFNILTEVSTQKVNTLSAHWNNQTKTILFSEQVAKAVLYDVNGKMVSETTNCTYLKPVSLSKGIYLIKAKELNTNKILTMKIINN
jgi:arabinogalactan endo-1,4-beta-galactosidase